MAFFKYKAKDKEGKEYEKTIEVGSRLDVYSAIREEQGTVVSIQEIKKLSVPISFGNLFSGISSHQKISFAKNLGSMMEAGLSVTRALSVMAKQSKNKRFVKVLTSLGDDVSHGEPLSSSLNKWPKTFSSLFVSMVKAGEESGNVSTSLKIVASQMEKNYQLVRKVRGALIYPAVIVSVMIVISILLLYYMVPTLTATFEGIGIALPLSTRVLIYVSDFLVNNTLLVLVGIIALVILAISFLRSRFGRNLFDSIVLRIPAIGPMIKEFESARTARTLSSLLSAGVEIVVALDVTNDVMQNHLYKNALTQAKGAIEKGDPMSAIFIKYDNLYPLFVGEMVAVGEETGKISEMLTGVADFYEEEVDQKTKDLSTIIEPVLMIIIGVGVGFFAVSMLAPTYSLVEHF